MVFGTNALVTKPAQSIAPMVTVAIFNQFGYSEFKAGTLSDVARLKHSMFVMACFVPVFIGAIQFVVWSRYKIRNTHLTIVKYVDT